MSTVEMRGDGSAFQFSFRDSFPNAPTRRAGNFVHGLCAGVERIFARNPRAIKMRNDGKPPVVSRGIRSNKIATCAGETAPVCF